MLKRLKKTKKKGKKGRERTWMLAVEGSSKIQGQQRFWVLFFPLYNCECCLIGRGKEFEKRGRESNRTEFICFYFLFFIFT